MNRKFLYLSPLAFILMACGGGDDGVTPQVAGGNSALTATGRFVDAAVQGISFQSGGQAGVTDASGTFTYEVGQPVTFRLGGVVLGSAQGAALVSPVDLVSGGSPSDARVRNIVRFLMAMDDDGDAGNGIQIREEVRTLSENWGAVDFDTADLDAALVSILAEVASVASVTPVLPSAGDAQSHLTASLFCAYSGGFRGTYSGDDSGQWAMVISARDGSLIGGFHSSVFNDDGLLSGTQALSLDSSRSFVTGVAGGTASFEGTLDSVDSMSGTWQDSTEGDSGTFTGSRIGGASGAVYRYTGFFTGDAAGLLSFDIDASGNLSGAAAAVDDSELAILAGSVNLSTGVLTATVPGDTQGTTNISATLNLAAGTLSNGAWAFTPNAGSSDAPESGSFTGDGCKLN